MAAGMSMGLGDGYGLQCRGAGKLQEGFLVGTCWESTRMGEEMAAAVSSFQRPLDTFNPPRAAPRDEPCT